jgi:acyl-CoA thioesterase-1
MMARRFRILLSIVLAFFVAAPALAQPHAPSRPQPASRPVRIMALGTSLTQGYGLPPGTEIPVQLQAALRAAGIDAIVVNAGVSGDTSADGLSRLDWALADKPDAAIIELGSNDMLRGLPPQNTEKNLRAILTRLKAAKIPVLLCGMGAQRNLGPEYVKQFDPIYPRLAREFGVLFYPFVLEGVAMKPELNQADGMHPNPAGVKVIVGKMLPLVKKLVSQASSSKMGR